MTPSHRSSLRRGLGSLGTFGLFVTALASSLAAQGANRLVSQSSAGAQGSGDSGNADVIDVTPDGRFVVFQSEASDLVAGDLNPSTDIFRRDRATGQTVLVSLTDAGGSADGANSHAHVSNDGQRVVFESWASNLVAGDAGFDPDVYVHDLTTGATVRVSALMGGGEPNGSAGSPDLSGDGRFVVFSSDADDLVPLDTNGAADVFLRDLATGALERLSVTPNGVEADALCLVPRISNDGMTVVFASAASTLVLPDANGATDVFAVDLTTGELSRVSVSSTGVLGNASSFLASLSADGRFVAFGSDSSNLTMPAGAVGTDVFLRDRVLGTTTLISRPVQGGVANAPSYRPDISLDGRYVAFDSHANNLAGGEATQLGDVWRADRLTGEIVLLSTNYFGGDATSFSQWPALSGDGSVAVFESYAYDIAGGDANGFSDVFEHDFTLTPPQSYCVGKPHSDGCIATMSYSGVPSLSSTSPFSARATEVRRKAKGVFFYSSEIDATPIFGGTLCVRTPLRRTPVQSAGGAQPCSGTFDFDFNDWLRTGNDPAVLAGSVLYGQYWFRDPNDPTGFDVGLTDALRFVVQP